MCYKSSSLRPPSDVASCPLTSSPGWSHCPLWEDMLNKKSQYSCKTPGLWDANTNILFRRNHKQPLMTLQSESLHVCTFFRHILKRGCRYLAHCLKVATLDFPQPVRFSPSRRSSSSCSNHLKKTSILSSSQSSSNFALQPLLKNRQHTTKNATVYVWSEHHLKTLENPRNPRKKQHKEKFDYYLHVLVVVDTGWDAPITIDILFSTPTAILVSALRSRCIFLLVLLFLRFQSAVLLPFAQFRRITSALGNTISSIFSSSLTFSLAFNDDACFWRRSWQWRCIWGVCKNIIIIADSSRHSFPGGILLQFTLFLLPLPPRCPLLYLRPSHKLPPTKFLLKRLPLPLQLLLQNIHHSQKNCICYSHPRPLLQSFPPVLLHLQSSIKTLQHFHGSHFLT